MTTAVHVDPGICGFQAAIKVTCEDGQHVTFEIESECAKVRAVDGLLKERGLIDAYGEIHPAKESAILSAGRQVQKGGCAACAVTLALFKGMQVAAGLSLMKDVQVRFPAEA